MTFPDALHAVFHANARITRRKWANRAIYCLLDSGLLCLKGFQYGGVDDGKSHPWTITEEDYFADDWEVVDA